MIMSDCPIVSTTGGLVKGKLIEATDPSAKPVCGFLGIPYGKPPIKKLRFLASERADPWDGVFDATHTFKLCPQVTSVAFLYDELIPFKNSMDHDDNSSDEDCLRLNIFTTKCEKASKMPVMVWLTGGHYQRNFGGRRNGSPLAGMNDTVIVVPNFRVNAFGYLSLGKGTCCPGNAALTDIILCLHWIRDNIKAFGGDPDNVTLFGESSGSGMVHLLMMSELSKGLFHKAVLMSGTVLSPFLFHESIDSLRDKFLEALGLDLKTMNEEEVLEKLQDLPVERIMEGQKYFEAQNFFMPTIDGCVITDSPNNLLKSGHVHKIPLLIGCTNSEGSGMLSMRIIPGYEDGLSEDVAKKIFVDIFQKTYKTDQGSAIFEKIKLLYANQIDQDSVTRFSQLHGEVMSDTVFVVPTVMTATAHNNLRNPTYVYQMTQVPEFNHSPTNGPDVRKRPDFVKCDHADDLHFLWGVAFEEGELTRGAYFTQKEIEFSRYVMTYFTNFAKSGNPNEPVEVPARWPEYESKEKSHMMLQMPLQVCNNLAMDKVAFFTQILQKMTSQ